MVAERTMARAAAVRVRSAGALPDPMLERGVMNLTLPRFAFRESDFTEVDVQLSQEFPWPGTPRRAHRAGKGRGADADGGGGGPRRDDRRPHRRAVLPAALRGRGACDPRAPAGAAGGRC